MRAINAAYDVLSDPRRRAAYDARLYLTARPVAARMPPQPVARRRAVILTAAPTSTPPTPLQQRVDRLVAILGVALLIGIGFYVVNVIPYAERQQELERRARSDRAYRQPAPLDPIAASGPGEHLRGAAIPGRLSADGGLRAFPGTVLVAPLSLPPFSSLPVARLDATGAGLARYAVYYGDLSTGGATISGRVGRTAFDSAVPQLADCPATSGHCAGPAPGQPADGSPPGLEVFRQADLIGGFPAFVAHRVCCNGVFWSVNWYEPSANMSYEIDLSRSIATLYGTPGVENDLAAARAVAALAPQLVRLP